MTHASEKRDSKTIGTVPHDQNEKYCLRAGKRTKVAIIYINEKDPAYPRPALGNIIRARAERQTRYQSSTDKTRRIARIACDTIDWITVRLVSQECRVQGATEPVPFNEGATK